TLAAEAVRGVPLADISLEACGQLGLDHNSLHEKTAGAWSPLVARLLSVCCCATCRARWSARGLDPDETVAALRTAVRQETELPPADPNDVVPHVHRLVAAGASRLSLYHLGLAPRRRWEILRAVMIATLSPRSSATGRYR